jgi:YcxB-like protein
MKISYRITREDFIDAQKLHRSKGHSAVVRAIRLGAKLVAVAIFLILLAWVVISGDRGLWPSLAPLFILGIIWAFAMWVWAPFYWRRCYAKDRRLQHDFTADISEDGIHLESLDFDAKLKWALYLRFLESDRVFLLYQTNRMFNLLPKAAFGPGEIEEFRQLAHRKLPDK